MSGRWWSKPVTVGAIVFGLLAFSYTEFMVAAFSCPGNYSNPFCMGDPLIPNLIRSGLAALLIGGSIGAGLGALYAMIRKRIRKNKGNTIEPEQLPIIPMAKDGSGEAAQHQSPYRRETDAE